MKTLAALEIPTEQLYFRCEIFEEDGELNLRFMKKYDTVEIEGLIDIKRLMLVILEAVDDYENSLKAAYVKDIMDQSTARDEMPMSMEELADSDEDIPDDYKYGGTK